MSIGELSGRTTWARNLQTPLREFLRTETGSAAVLLAGAVAALVWANIGSSYESVWHATLSVRIAGGAVALDLRHWVNSGLMALFFFVVGLEARREFDLGELRDRRRLLLPLLAGIGGMAVPVGLFALIGGGHAAGGGWGVAMSTDTAFALGMLALVGRRFPVSLRAFMLTVAVVDDLVAILVIAIFFSGSVSLVPLWAALGAFAGIGALRVRGVRNGAPYLVLGVTAWVAVLKSGIDPIVVGLAIGLLTIAYPAAREDLERATDLFRVFREQPTSELEREARIGLRTAISPNERLAQMFHPFTSYVVVPLFALANTGFPITGSFLAHAYGSALTLGILVAYVVGKPLGICGMTGLVTRLTRGRVRAPVGWASVLGGGTVAGIGFTVSLLIATLAFRGPSLSEAKLGVLTTIVAAPVLTWAVQAASRMLPRRVRAGALIGSAEQIIDLAVPVDPERDHIRGPDEALVTLLEYGDLECPFCGQAEPVVRELLSDFGELRYVWRHLPLTDVHPHAQLAAEAAEAAGAQSRFWEMHDLMFEHQDALTVRDILGYARELELDLDRFKLHLRKRKGASRIADDVESADLSGVSGTPTFFINGHRHQGAYDIATLSRAVKLAGARSKLRA
ncbi:MAG TPA: Na+/H+ antiporter NhaA [Solirubrobacteraceae bacterium]|nr:Na+/H+ antiporter NhaA [Solirubrobacteraceae bacterium]